MCLYDSCFSDEEFLKTSALEISDFPQSIVIMLP